MLAKIIPQKFIPPTNFGDLQNFIVSKISLLYSTLNTKTYFELVLNKFMRYFKISIYIANMYFIAETIKGVN